MFIAQRAVEILVNRIDERLHTEGAFFQKEKKMYFKRAKEALDKFTYWMDQIEPCYINGCKGDWKDYDLIRQDANDVCRLLLLFADRCNTREKADIVYKLLRTLETSGYITEEELEHFNYRYKK